MNPTRTLACAAALAAVAAFPAAAQTLPAHPDQLKFPSLSYTAPKAATYRVKLSNGMVAFLVPDRSTPLVQVTVLMRMGPQLDPAGKEGLALMTANLLTRSGTATLNADQVEARVAALGANLDSGVGGGGGGFFGMGGAPIGPTEARASINCLSKDLDEGLGLLTDCLRGAAFQEDRVKLLREQQLNNMKRRNDESGDIEEREWSALLRGESHWSNRWTTKASLEGITGDDLRAFQKRYVGPRNFLLAVSGDFDRADMVRRLERAFAKWPVPGERPGLPPAPTEPAKGGWYMVEKDVNQGRVSIGLPTLDRYDADWAAARILNDILGGGGFTSRLVNRIRSDEGLAYSVNSRIEGGTYYAEPWRLVFQSKVRSVAFATEIAMTEIGRIRDSLVTSVELEASRAKFIESLPSQFETAAAIAGGLAVDELTGRSERDPAYWSEYSQRLNAVTAEDVRRVARRLLDPKRMTVLMVGNTKDMLLGDGKHDASIVKLAGGEPKRLPLRDPFTMRPLQANPN
jgi:predicted Zn-dependent peptidase